MSSWRLPLPAGPTRQRLSAAVIHSSEPKVREETIDSYIARATKDLKKKDAEGKPRLVGFKFLRLQDDPFKKLEGIDGPDALRVTLPSGGQLRTQ